MTPGQDGSSLRWGFPHGRGDGLVRHRGPLRNAARVFAVSDMPLQLLAFDGFATGGGPFCLTAVVSNGSAHGTSFGSTLQFACQRGTVGRRFAKQE